MRAIPHALACCFLASICTTAAQADTLREIYELALANDAQLKAAEATYKANLEVERIGLSALLPQVQGNYQYTDSDTDTKSDSVNVGDDGLEIFEVKTNVDVDREGYEVSLDQAIFDMPAWFTFRAGREPSREA